MNKETRLYRTWANMKQRCHNPKAHKYSSYGGKGVIVCALWRKSFAAFEKWALRSGYRDDLTIDRIEGWKGYRPSNCRWVTLEFNRSHRTYSPRALRSLAILAGDDPNGKAKAA